MYFSGHGFDFGGQTLLFAPDRDIDNPEKLGDKPKFQLLNLTRLAKRLAEIKNCFSLIFFDGTHHNLSKNMKLLDRYKPCSEIFDVNKIEEKNPLPGYSAIIYTVPRYGFNTPDSNGNTMGAIRLKECF